MSDTLTVLLVCGSGASSGFMAQRMRKAAKKRGLTYEIEARSESELDAALASIDVLMLGPHLRYMEDQIRERTSGSTVEVTVIPESIYGVLDGDAALDLLESIRTA